MDKSTLISYDKIPENIMGNNFDVDIFKQSSAFESHASAISCSRIQKLWKKYNSSLYSLLWFTEALFIEI